MLEQELELPSLDISPAPDGVQNPGRCFIVPVALPDADDPGVLHRIWELASRSGAEVRFAGLCAEKAREPELRRTLIRMAAMLRSGGVKARVEMLNGRANWVHQIRSSLGTEDLVIFQDGRSQGLLQRSLSRRLQADLDASILILSGTEVSQGIQPGWLVRAAAWIGTLAIVAGFFVLQARIDLLGGSLAVLLESLSVAAEVVLICIWNAWLE